MRMQAGSLRARLVLGAVTVGLFFAAVFGVIATLRLHQVENGAVGSALRTRLDLARDQVASDGSLNQDRGRPRTELIQVLAPDGRVLTASSALDGVPALVTLADVLRSGTGGTQSTRALQRPDIDLATLAVPLDIAATGQSPGGAGALVVAVDAEGFTAARSDLLRLLLLGLLSVVVAIGALAWVLAGRALRSVTVLTEEAESIRPNNLDVGLPVPVRDAELARLVGALNRMLRRLHRSHSRELAFAADAGHRLRTPLATLRAEAELALREPEPAQQRAALGRIVEDADQLSGIVDRMLTRTRRSSRSALPIREALDTAAVRWARQGGVVGVGVAVRLPSQLADEVTSPELGDVLEPVMDNAIRYTAPGSDVVVDVQLAYPGLVVDVTNPGVGVEKRLAPHIFDAWVSGRDASLAGGLGLWLARETAVDAGGDVTLVDPGPGATTFRVTLPILQANATSSGSI